MRLTIEFEGTAAERVAEAASLAGVEPRRYAERLVLDHLPASAQRPKSRTRALLEAALEEDLVTDPRESELAEAELLQFMRDMNRPRKEAGARLLYPEAEQE